MTTPQAQPGRPLDPEKPDPQAAPESTSDERRKLGLIALVGVQVGGAEAKSAKEKAAAAIDTASKECARADKAEADKTQVLQANAALLARPDAAPAVLNSSPSSSHWRCLEHNVQEHSDQRKV
jgi:hypothetical protein